MKKFIVISVAVALSGCSQEQREDAIDRVTSAAKELNGVANTTPTIVAEARRKEKHRQDTQWTKENQALHPIEYCQAQLEELDKMAQSLQVQVHSVATAKAGEARKESDAESKISGLAKLLHDAKDAYRVAEASNNWPIVVNGFRLSREKAQDKIVDAAQKITDLKSIIDRCKQTIVVLEKKSTRLDQEQRKLVSIRERVQATLDDLRTKQVVDGANGIADALNAISDSMASFGHENDDPALDDLMVPDAKESRLLKFNEIMSND